MDLGLEGRNAVITGGSKGIGLAIAHALAQENASIAICARHEADLEQAATEIREHGGRIHTFVADVTVPEQVERFIAESADALGGIDILVNNAGAAHPGSFESLTDKAWHDDLDVKLFSQIRCTRAALQHLRHSDAPRVININAVYARYPDPKFFATTVNRAACLNFTKALAIELGPEKILVNSVNIGFVVTHSGKTSVNYVHPRRLLTSSSPSWPRRKSPSAASVAPRRCPASLPSWPVIVPAT